MLSTREINVVYRIRDIRTGKWWSGKTIYLSKAAADKVSRGAYEVVAFELKEIKR